ncbi:MAG TPA: S8 family peptidase [Pyrinomonadaceae bacterium]
MKKIFALFVAVALCAMAIPSLHVQSQKNGNAASHNEAASVPGEILIQFRYDATDEDKGRALGRVNGEALENIKTKATRHDGRGDLILAHFQPDFTPAAARRALENDPAVEFAEPNYIYTHQAVSNDPYYTNGSLWGMYGDATTPANQFGSQAGEAWAAGHTGSNTVYVGIIDEGIQFTHPDLDANVWTNPFDPVDGIDNDGNGYIDDIHGWDFDGNNNTIYDGGTQGKLDDHGTHVTGTIGAEGGNSIGVVGVNWSVTYISGKFLGRRGGTTANAIKAVDYFTDLKTRHGLNIVATNNSWGGGGFSQALLDAITRGAQQNILFIAAAGNGGADGVGDNNDTTPSYPSNYNTTAGAGYDAVIAVAAITSTGGLASFSNYGLTTVDIGAPGSGIWSTTAFNTYSSFSGTSMATPHVTGGAALYASTHPGATALQIKTAILSSAVPTPSLAGKCVTGGRLNVSGF